MSTDYGFVVQVTLVLVIRERRHKMTWAMLVPRKATEFPWIAKRAVRFIDQLGHNRVTLRCEYEPAIEALEREKSHNLTKREARLFQRGRRWEKASPMGSWNVRQDSLPVRPEH